MIFNIQPIPKPRMTRNSSWRYKDYWAFKEAVALMARAKKFSLKDEYSVVFTIMMPDSWSNKKKAEYDGSPHKQRPDLDNLVKAIQDCLLDNDSSIHCFKAKKIWGYSPSIEITEL